MRTYEEIYDLFIDLIKGNIDEVKVTFAEMNMLDKKVPHFGWNGVNVYLEGFHYTQADIIRELCKKYHIELNIDFKDYDFKFRKG